MTKLRLALLLNVALLGALLTTCGSCAFPRPAYQRTTPRQYDAGVKIAVYCDNVISHHGSGVIVSHNRVLTAKHVVQCELFPGLPLYMTPDRITVDPGDGVAREATVELTLGEGSRDIARLEVSASLEKYSSPVSIGPKPEIGDRLCMTSVAPRPTFRCGLTQQSNEYISVEMRVEHGNSGSGLYNIRGQLVGIVVRLWLCEGNEFCGGLAAPLQDMDYLLP